VLWGATGLSYGLSLAMVLSAFWLSRRRASAAHLLLLLVFAAAAAAGVGRLAWYGPVFALVLVPYLAELWRHLWPARKPAPAAVPDDDRPRFTTGPSWHYSVICAILAWMAFALSPISASLMGRLPRTLGQLVGPTVPLALAGHLAANPPRGQIFNPMHWGHWLALEGPPGLKTFVTTDTRVIPRQVWGSYLRLVDAGYELQEILGLYRIDTVIVDKIMQTRLARAMRAADGWTLQYDDNLAMVFVRKAGEEMVAPEPAAAATGDPLIGPSPAATTPATMEDNYDA